MSPTMATSKPVRAEDPTRWIGKGDSGTDALVEYGTVFVVSAIAIFAEMAIRLYIDGLAAFVLDNTIRETREEWRTVRLRAGHRG